jgi:hypothetical protein
MHVHVIAIGTWIPERSGVRQSPRRRIRECSGDTQATGCAGITFAVWLAARDPSLLS